MQNAFCNDVVKIVSNTHDLADALRFLLENHDSPQIISVGCGYNITIRDLALLVAKVVGIDAELVFDSSKPDGTPRKLLDTSHLPKDHPGRWSSGCLSMVFAEFGTSMLASTRNATPPCKPEQ
jgi:hypothetical protein